MNFYRDDPQEATNPASLICLEFVSSGASDAMLVPALNILFEQARIVTMETVLLDPALLRTSSGYGSEEIRLGLSEYARVKLKLMYQLSLRKPDFDALRVLHAQVPALLVMGTITASEAARLTALCIHGFNVLGVGDMGDRARAQRQLMGAACPGQFFDGAGSAYDEVLSDVAVQEMVENGDADSGASRLPGWTRGDLRPDGYRLLPATDVGEAPERPSSPVLLGPDGSGNSVDGDGEEGQETEFRPFVGAPASDSDGDSLPPLIVRIDLTALAAVPAPAPDVAGLIAALRQLVNDPLEGGLIVRDGSSPRMAPLDSPDLIVPDSDDTRWLVDLYRALEGLAPGYTLPFSGGELPFLALLYCVCENKGGTVADFCQLLSGGNYFEKQTVPTRPDGLVEGAFFETEEQRQSVLRPTRLAELKRVLSAPYSPAFKRPMVYSAASFWCGPSDTASDATVDAGSPDPLSVELIDPASPQQVKL